jgi:hypothetical protein
MPPPTQSNTNTFPLRDWVQSNKPPKTWLVNPLRYLRSMQPSHLASTVISFPPGLNINSKPEDYCGAWQATNGSGRWTRIGFSRSGCTPPVRDLHRMLMLTGHPITAAILSRSFRTSNTGSCPVSSNFKSVGNFLLDPAQYNFSKCALKRGHGYKCPGCGFHGLLYSAETLTFPGAFVANPLLFIAFPIYQNCASCSIIQVW